MGTESSTTVAAQSPTTDTNGTFNRRVGGGAYKLFDVSRRKFAILSATTLSLYVYYWAFRNWQAIQRETGERMSPFWRAFFGTLWNFSLFKIIQKNARDVGIPVGWESALLAALFFGITDQRQFLNVLQILIKRCGRRRSEIALRRSGLGHLLHTRSFPMKAG